MNIAHKLLTGSALRFTSLILEIAVAFYLMPFVIHSLGDRWYGMWVIIGTFMGYYNVLDMGITSAVQRFIAHALPGKNENELNEILVTSLVIFSGIAVLAVIVTLIAVFSAGYFFDNEEEIRTFSIICILLGINTTIGFPYSSIMAVLTANLRYDYINYIKLIKLLIRTSLIIYFLGKGYSIISLAAITLSTNVLGHIITFAVATRVSPWMRFQIKYYNRKRARSLFGFGMYSFISWIGDTIRFNIDNIVIASYLTLSNVTHYNIAVRLVDYFMQAVGSLIGIMSPVFAQLHRKNEHEKIKETFIFATRLSTIFSVTFAGGIIIFGYDFLMLWMGEQYQDSYILLSILVLAMSVDVMQIPTINLLYAINKNKAYAKINMAEAFANLGLSLILVNYYGMIGVALGTAIPVLLMKITIQPKYICKQLNINYTSYMKEVLLLAATIIIMQLPIYFILLEYTIRDYFTLLYIGLLYYLPLGFIIFRFILRKSERHYLYNVFPALKKLG